MTEQSLAKLEARRQNRRSPQVAGILPRSLYGHSDRMRAWSIALDGARGNIRATPVFANREWIGITQGRDPFTPEVRARPIPRGMSEDAIGNLCDEMDRDRAADSIARARPRTTRERARDWRLADIQNPSDVAAAISAGRYTERWWWKNHGTTGIVNTWYDYWPVGGVPTSGLMNGAARTFVPLDDTAQGAFQHGGNVSTFVKRGLNLMGMSSTNTPMLEWYDRLGEYDGCTITAASSQNFTNTLPPTRYMATGQGGLVVCENNTVLSATATNLTVLTYVDDANNASQLMPTTTTVGLIPSAAAPTATLGARVVAPSSGAAPTYGFHLPTAPGDTGVRSLTNFTHSAANTGTVTYAMIYPLGRLIVPVATIASEIDLFFQIMKLPRIYDGACLCMLAYQPTTGASITGGSYSVCWN